MTYEEKKAWLRRYQQAKRLEQLRLDELDTLKTDASNMTQCLSAVPGGGGDGQTLPRAVERIDEARALTKPSVRKAPAFAKKSSLRYSSWMMSLTSRFCTGDISVGTSGS